MSPNNTLTAIEGLRVGHAVLDGIPSGCTVVLSEGGAVAGVDIRGGAPGTFGTDALNPLNLVERVHGLFFTGGSAFGLGVAEGVRRYLRERGAGFDTGYGLVPIVAGAVIFDLGLNHTQRYPDADLGYRACRAASRDPVPEGCRGAGAGATAGKLQGLRQGMKSGLGSFFIQGSSGVQVAALMVVNPFGDVVDPVCGRVVAGCRSSAESLELLVADRELQHLKQARGGFKEGRDVAPESQSTVIGVVATNARLNKTQLTKVAQMAQDGLARTIYPAHTLYDGDAVFALGCGDLEGVEVNVVGSLAARAAAQAILRGVRKADPWGFLPAHRDLSPEKWGLHPYVSMD